jgi:hypothetical protein
MRELSTFAYDVCRRFALDHEDLIGRDELNQILGWIRSRNIKALSQLSEQEGTYKHPSVCAFRRQVSAFFKKNVVLTSEGTEQAALASFMEAEAICKVTNRRLDTFYNDTDELNPNVKDVINRAQRIIRYTLGDISAFSNHITDYLTLTSGATASRPRREAFPFKKLNIRNISCTPRAKPFIERLAADFGYKKTTFKVRTSNRVALVPKNWKTDRTIACEPDWNVPFQLAFDEYCKRRLSKKLGIDLSDQSKNQRLAKEGSVSGDYATIDLSAASDTIAFNTVALMLPYEWFHYLCIFRSPYGVMPDNTEIKFEKFSSMGNGSTFCIETLIFGALVKALSSRGDHFSVYGDDIIIKTEYVDLLTEVFDYLGFSINKQKSFTSGPFRESCGTDWYDGVNVTPIYIRHKMRGKPELIHLVNSLASVAIPNGELERFLLDLVDEEQLPLVPWNESTISGVWVDPHSAYSVGLIKTHNEKDRKKPSYQHPMFLGFVPKQGRKLVTDSRTLALWHLKRLGVTVKNHRHSFLDAYFVRHVDVADETCTLVPLPSHKYVRRWVAWIIPSQAAPVHLYRWSEALIHESRSELQG